MKKTLKYSLTTLSIVAIGTVTLLYFQHEKYFPNTDDAYVGAHIVNVAPRVDGMVNRLCVHEHEYVKTGQLLFELDPMPYQVALRKAQAHLDDTKQQVAAAESDVKVSAALVAQRQAQLINTRKQTQRTLTLVKQGYYAPSKGDEAKSQLDVAKASLTASLEQLQEARQKLGELGDSNASIRTAKAAVEQAKLNLAYTKVCAANSGYLVNMNLRVGDDINAYQQVFALVESKQWWVSANFKESDMQRIKVGQPAEIKLDMYPDHVFQGKVISISHGSGASFSLLPPENATGNWVKVTQRFPIRISIKDQKQYPLRVGASSTVTVNTTS